MENIKSRLVNCFKLVFADLPEEAIPTASQSTVAAWDSVAAITLVNVIEDEFQIQMDLDQLADLDTFDKIADHLSAYPQVV